MLIAIALVTPFLRPWYRKWGATDAEVDRSLPGDDLVAYPKGDYTHAITIRASAAEIWPWLVQLGQGRGGFYGYEWIENLVGCQIHNADHIIPEFQHLEVGDSVWPFWLGEAPDPHWFGGFCYSAPTVPF